MSAPNIDQEKDKPRLGAATMNSKEIAVISKTFSMLACEEKGHSFSVNGECDQEWILQIDLSGRCLVSLPDFLPQYQYCTSLNLSGNSLECDIDWLIHLKRLESLNLSHNKITKIADVCGSVLTLEHLDLSYNLLKELPEWILMLEKVKSLNLGYNPLQKDCHFHLKKAKWKNIEICHLEYINLVSLPDCFQTAINLKELYLGSSEKKKTIYYENNVLWRVPELLPASISKLDLSYVSLSNLDYDWKKLVNLKELRAKGNDLFWPSEDFILLKNLETCDMSFSKVFLLPRDFGFLSHLSFLNLSFNKLAVIPKSFELFHNLVHLDLYNSAIESIECSLDQLLRLHKCDIWLNLVDPVEFLINHSELCHNLRETLSPQEKEGRINRRSCLSNIQGLKDVHSRPKLEELSSGTEDEDSYGDQLNQASTEVPADDPHEVTTSLYRNGVEEPWDEKVFSDEEFDELELDHIDKDLTNCKSQDDHFFLPSQLHALSCSLPPNQFLTIQGQFDDVD